MRYICVITGSFAIFAASLSGAQEGADERMPSCIAEPIFHCARHFEAGNAIGFFGYRLQCSGEAEPAAELYIDIGDDNRFSTDRIDRGQPKVFVPGEHVDEFSVEFSAKEVQAATTIQWSVMGNTATVDFSKTKDGSLDCSDLL
jgi:hypothetical protein